MKNKIINAAICDARNVTEESLSGFDSITINTSVLITGAHAKELLNRYPVTINTASFVDTSDGVSVQVINGKHEIGPDADGTDVFLFVNGTLTLENGSLEAVKRYHKIQANGKTLMPRSYKGQFRNISQNGRSLYYPDGAAILKANTEIDTLFIARSGGPIYYCPGRMFFLDTALDTAKLLEKGLRFSAEQIVIAECLAAKLLPCLDEEAELVRVPDGTRLLRESVDLKPKTIRKYGSKLYVRGDVSIQDAEALSALEFLYAEGTVRVDRDLESTFDALESIYQELKITSPDICCLSERMEVKVGTAMLNQYPKGIQIEDCATVTLSEDLSPDDILKKLRISDCAVVRCSRAQEEAVHMISEDVAKIDASMGSDDQAGPFDGLFGNSKDTQVINAAEYSL